MLSNPASKSVVLAFRQIPQTIGAANLLAEQCDRQLLVADFDETSLEAAFRKAPTDGSVCIVAGPVSATKSWEGSNDGISLQQMGMLLRSCRCASENRPGTAFGIVTAPDSDRFHSHVHKGKSVLEALRTEAVLAIPRTGPTWSADDRPQIPVELGGPVSTLPTSALLCYLDDVKSRRFSTIIVEGHGRSYCVNEGQFCGGGEGGVADGESKFTCLDRLDCASSRHLRLPVDTFSAGLMILDACEAGSFVSPAVRMGFPPISVGALRQIEAVIATDVAVVRRNDDVKRIVECARRCRTLGDLVVAINRLRTRGNPRMPYHLLGDPEWPCPAYLSNTYASVQTEVDQREMSLSLSAPLKEALNAIHQQALAGGSVSQLLNCMSRALADVITRAETVAWPHGLWSVASVATDVVRTPCPSCGIPEQFVRSYKSFDGNRVFVDCGHCRLLFDYPAKSTTTLSISSACSNTFPVGESAEFVVTICAGSEGCVGVVAISSGAETGGPSIHPKIHEVALGLGQSKSLSITCILDDPHQTAQIYYLKVMAILNGQIHLTGAPVVVSHGSQQRSEA
ncbi:hypothetical protein CLV41_12126 [Roseibium marinum]|uniref:Uncharacterized protein n=2 Tax=Roseibium marinum TaxID=281252 RepID=A0A2S3UJN9_9HYPH|nr:hypothetical protein CLV41_12126 [Roseibium marinum]